MLTRKQHELLMFIDKHLRETGFSPSFEEMKEALNLRSKSGIHRLIHAREDRGFFRPLPHRVASRASMRWMLGPTSCPDPPLGADACPGALVLLSQERPTAEGIYDVVAAAYRTRYWRHRGSTLAVPCWLAAAPDTAAQTTTWALLQDDGRRLALTVAPGTDSSHDYLHLQQWWLSNTQAGASTHAWGWPHTEWGRWDRPGYWKSVTGGKDTIEEPLQLTCSREVFEGTGIDVTGHRLTDWQHTNRYEIYPHWRHRYPDGVTHLSLITT